MERFLSVSNNVYRKSCSARVNFHKINGAKPISSIANPSVLLGKHRVLPCERGSGSLHLLLAACSLEHGPRSEQPYPSASPAPRACAPGQSPASLTVLFAVSSREMAGHPGRSAQPSKD